MFKVSKLLYSTILTLTDFYLVSDPSYNYWKIIWIAALYNFRHIWINYLQYNNRMRNLFGNGEIIFISSSFLWVLSSWLIHLRGGGRKQMTHTGKSTIFCCCSCGRFFFLSPSQLVNLSKEHKIWLRFSVVTFYSQGAFVQLRNSSSPYFMVRIFWVM